MAKHARLSASNAERWMTCPGSVPLTEHLPNESSEYADEGTAAHFLAAECLSREVDAKSFQGRTIALCKDTNGEHFETFEELVRTFDEGVKVRNTFHVDAEMIRYVQKYLDDVRRVALAMNGTILVEQRLSIEFLTGEEDAESTADTIILGTHPETLVPTIATIDLKYGQGEAVSAINNKQIRMYGSAAREAYSMLDDYGHYHNVIHQPRLNSVTEDKMGNPEMDTFNAEVIAAAQKVQEATIAFQNKEDMTPYLQASEKGCRWCKHANCDVRTKYIEDIVGADMKDLTELAAKEVDKLVALKSDPPSEEELQVLSLRARAIPIIESWIKAVRGKVESLLFAGVSVPDWKLVEGKAGHRKWVDEDEAVKAMKKLKLKTDQIYTKSVISPAQVENLLEPAQFSTLAEQIKQAKGATSVAPASDKRPAISVTPVEEEMVDLTDVAEEDDLLGV